jgi:aromatic ring-opening dioxygenase catalytic subunit (LigB family)
MTTEATAAGGKLPTIYIPHGGGPCFFMEWTMGPKDTWVRMADWLKRLAASVGTRPKAILVISAHWEEPAFTVMTGAWPPLLFDYYGFPEHTYQLTYAAPGSPALARRVRDLLANAGIGSGEDAARGFDHGVFVPLKLIYPEAEIPVLQLSLKAGLDPAQHLAAGLALVPLREEGVLIVGSGMSYHNMRGFMTAAGGPVSERFDAWLTDAVADADPERRNQRLAHWEEAPSARAAHPREEHLLPLMVVAGAGGEDPGQRIFTDHVMGVAVSAFAFGG